MKTIREKIANRLLTESVDETPVTNTSNTDAKVEEAIDYKAFGLHDTNVVKEEEDVIGKFDASNTEVSVEESGGDDNKVIIAETDDDGAIEKVYEADYTDVDDESSDDADVSDDEIEVELENDDDEESHVEPDGDECPVEDSETEENSTEEPEEERVTESVIGKIRPIRETVFIPTKRIVLEGVKYTVAGKAKVIKKSGFKKKTNRIRVTEATAIQEEQILNMLTENMTPEERRNYNKAYYQRRHAILLARAKKRQKDNYAKYAKKYNKTGTSKLREENEEDVSPLEKEISEKVKLELYKEANTNMEKTVKENDIKDIRISKDENTLQPTDPVAPTPDNTSNVDPTISEGSTDGETHHPDHEISDEEISSYGKGVSEESDEPVDNTSNAEFTVSEGSTDGETYHPDHIIKEEFAGIFKGQTLTEDFKTKVITLFESKVNKTIKEEIAKRTDKIADAADRVIAEEVAKIENKLNTSISSFMDHLAEEYMKENAVAIESGLKVVVAEEFISSLKGLLTESGITISEEKVSLVEEYKDRAAKYKKEADKALSEVATLKSQLTESKKVNIFGMISEGMIATDRDKLSKLAETVQYTTPKEYAAKLKVLKEEVVRPTKPTVNKESADPNRQLIVESVNSSPAVDTTEITDPVVRYAVEQLNRLRK